MKTDKIYIGDILKCTYLNKNEGYQKRRWESEGQDGSILMGGYVDNFKVISPSVLITNMDAAWCFINNEAYPKAPQKVGDIFVGNIRLFNYKDIQSKENISRLRLYFLYREYLRSLVYTEDLYLGDIVRSTYDPTKPTEKKFVGDYRICHTTFGHETIINDKDGYETLASNVLLKEFSNGKYYSYSHLGVFDIKPTEYEKIYVRNIKKFNYENIGEYVQVPLEDAKKAHRNYKIALKK